ncbi:MAG: Ku protein, partial [Burkholderiaceae bacterium]
ELQLANQLIDSITSETFDPSKYEDDVKERIEAQIKKKVEGEEITAPEAPEAAKGAKVIDIMDALRASLQRRTGGNGAADEGKAPARKAATKKQSAKKTAKKTSTRTARRAA